MAESAAATTATSTGLPAGGIQGGRKLFASGVQGGGKSLGSAPHGLTGCLETFLGDGHCLGYATLDETPYMTRFVILD